MKQNTGLGIGVVAIAILAAGGGYWVGHRGGAPMAPAGAGATLAGASAPAGDTTKQEKKLLYYRNPMGLPDTSPVPKKDPMGMDYIAVFAGGDENEPAAPGQIRISTEKVQKLGVRTEAARSRALDQTVRAAGRVEPDERRVYAIAPKFEGYVERLLVNVTGQPVSKGQPLFEVYSPELVSAQREYAIAMQGVASLKDAGGTAQTGMQQLAESSLQRLRSWDISDEQIKALASSGEAKRTLTFRSTASGIVTEKKAVQGMRFMPGEALYQVADLSSVWVIADVFEQDIGLIKSGATAKIRINAYPDKAVRGQGDLCLSDAQGGDAHRAGPCGAGQPGPAAQAGHVRAGGTVGPGQRLGGHRAGVGRHRQRHAPDRADPERRRALRAARGQAGRAQRHDVEVIEGVKDGEQVVVAANFLIDAESNLKAAISGFSSAPAAAPAKAEMPSTTGSATPTGAGHQAQGTVDSVDAKAGMINLSHGPVPSLKWPAMTMEFKAANASLLQGLKPGAKIAIEFIERQPGEWVITRVDPVAVNASAGAPASAAKAHTGH